MHAYQPITAEEFQISIFKYIGEDWMLVTAEKDGKTNSLTASWGGLGVIWGKNAAFIFINENSYTRELIDASDTFSLSFFGGSYKRELKYIKVISGRDEDKIHNARFNVGYHNDVPFIDEANTVLICKKMAAQPIHRDAILEPDTLNKWYKDAHEHIMYVGEITDFLVR